MGGITRGDSTQKKLALVFTGDEFADGGKEIRRILKEHKIRASFFFTGRFYRNNDFKNIIQSLKEDGHYLGAHSDQHLLYCDWSKRDSLLVSQELFQNDLLANYRAMEAFKVQKPQVPYFLPPFEWYNDSISRWTKELGLQLINYTAGTFSTADYTWPGLKNYKSSEQILNSIINREKNNPAGLNGYILLLHIGTDPRRTDKFYSILPALVRQILEKGYQFQRVDELLTNH